MLSKSVTELEKLSYLPREVRQHNPLSMQNIKKYFKANSFSDKKLVAEIRSRSPGSVLKKEKSLALGTTKCSLPICKKLLRYQVIPQLAENAICSFHFFLVRLLQNVLSFAKMDRRF